MTDKEAIEKLQKELAESLANRAVGVEELNEIFDKFRQVQQGTSTIGVMMNMRLRDKIVADILSRYIILKKKGSM